MYETREIQEGDKVQHKSEHWCGDVVNAESTVLPTNSVFVKRESDEEEKAIVSRDDLVLLIGESPDVEGELDHARKAAALLDEAISELSKARQKTDEEDAEEIIDHVISMGEHTAEILSKTTNVVERLRDDEDGDEGGVRING